MVARGWRNDGELSGGRRALQCWSILPVVDIRPYTNDKLFGIKYTHCIHMVQDWGNLDKIGELYQWQYPDGDILRFYKLTLG